MPSYKEIDMAENMQIGLRSLGGRPASEANQHQVSHARWALQLADRGEFKGNPRHLEDYRAIVTAADGWPASGLMV